jgi:ElaB/YqjD/DUF883 family membrane-anchored ribosome-binding protein
MSADTPSGSGGEPRTPEEIRREIDETREELGDTVEALAAKTDVKAQVKGRVQEIRGDAAQRKDELLAKATDAVPESAGAGAQQVADTVKSKPIPFSAAGAFAAGVALGWLIGRR